MSDHLKQQQEDHDLLISIKTTLDIVVRDLKEMKDNMSKRVNTLEENKLSIAEAARLKAEGDAVHKDHEDRLRRLEWWGTLAIGGLAVIQFLLFYLK